MARPKPALLEAGASFLLGVGASGAAYLVAWRWGSDSPPAMIVGGGVFVALTVVAGWVARDLIQGYVSLASGVALLPALATALSPMSADDLLAPISSALLFVLLATPGFMTGVIAAGIAGRRGRRR